jgi:hypothetical protein
MRNTTILILVIVVTVLVGGWFFLASRQSASPPAATEVQENSAPPSGAGNAPKYQRPPPRIHPGSAALAETETDEPQKTGENLAARLGLTPDQLESYLQKRQRSAESLITVFRATGDKAYLVEAAQQFPGDPRVQLGVLVENLYPEQQREWIDRFKKSAPENSFASYLSALDNYQQGDSAAALKDLAMAQQKRAFKDYSVDQMRGLEDLVVSSGKPERVAKESTVNAVPMAEYGMVKQLTQEMTSQQDKYHEAGDTGAVETLARMGVDLANRFVGEDGGRFLMGQLVGMAIEARFLKQLDQDKVYDFLAQTPAQRQETLTTKRQNLKGLTGDISQRLSQVSDAEANLYFDRIKTSGEIEAIRWLREH